MEGQVSELSVLGVSVFSFFASPGGPNAGKTIIFIKKCPKIEFRAAKSCPMIVISSFLEALEDIIVYLESFGAILSCKMFFVNRRAQK